MNFLPGDIIRLSAKGHKYLKLKYPKGNIDKLYNTDLIVSETHHERGETMESYIVRDHPEIIIPLKAIVGYVEPEEPKPAKKTKVKEPKIGREAFTITDVAVAIALAVLIINVFIWLFR